MEININLTAREIEILLASLKLADACGSLNGDETELFAKLDEARNRVSMYNPSEILADEYFNDFRMIGGIPTKSCLMRFISKRKEFAPTYGHKQNGPHTVTIFAPMVYCRQVIDRLKAQGAKIGDISHTLSYTSITFIQTH